MAISFLDKLQARAYANQLKADLDAKGIDTEIRITPKLEGKNQTPKYKVWLPDVRY